MSSCIVVADLHGRFDLYEKFVNLWESSYDYIIFLGDLIENEPRIDQSCEILNDIEQRIDNKRFIVLKGNHEACHIQNETIYKNNKPSSNLFRNQIRKKNKGKLEPYYTNYKKLFKKFRDYYILNKIFFSHAGPNNSFQLPKMEFFHWNRYEEDYNEQDVDNFLNKLNLLYMVVGHNDIKYPMWYGNQFILKSDDGHYLDININDKITKKNFQIKKN